MEELLDIVSDYVTVDEDEAAQARGPEAVAVMLRGVCDAIDAGGEPPCNVSRETVRLAALNEFCAVYDADRLAPKQASVPA